MILRSPASNTTGIAIAIVIISSVGCNTDPTAQSLGETKKASTSASADSECSQAIIDQSSNGLDNVRCSGPWQYKRYPPCYAAVTDGKLCGYLAQCLPMLSPLQLSADPGTDPCKAFSPCGARTCRLPPNLDPDQSACGLPPEGAPVYSRPGLTYAEVRAEDRSAANSQDAIPTCTTGEELPTDTPAAVKYKFDRMAQFLSLKNDSFEAPSRTATLLYYEFINSGTAPVGSEALFYVSEPIPFGGYGEPIPYDAYGSAELNFLIEHDPSNSVSKETVQVQVSQGSAGWISAGPPIPVYAQSNAAERVRVDLSQFLSAEPAQIRVGLKRENAGCNAINIRKLTVSANIFTKFTDAHLANEADLLYSEGFETNAWSNTKVSGTVAAWSMEQTGEYPRVFPHGSSTLARFNSYNASDGESARIHTTTDVPRSSNYTGLKLLFWMYHDPGYQSEDDQIQVQVSTDSSTWLDVGLPISRYASTRGWVQASIDLTEYLGAPHLYIGFLGKSRWGNNIYLDDVTLWGIRPGAELVFSDGFEGASWSATQISGSGAPWDTTSRGLFPNATPHGGMRFARFDSLGAAAGSRSRIAANRAIDLSSRYASAKLVFWMYHDRNYYGSDDRVQTQISTDGATWHDVGSPISRYSVENGWVQASVDISAYLGAQRLYLGFLGTSEHGYQMYLDDVAIWGTPPKAERVFSDSFENQTWTSTQVSGTASWQLVEQGTFPSSTPNDGARLASFYSHETLPGSMARFSSTTAISVPDIYKSVTLTFWMYYDANLLALGDVIRAQVSSDGVSWANAGPAMAHYSSSPGWIQVSVDITAHASKPKFYIGFLGIGMAGINNIHLDDIAIWGVQPTAAIPVSYTRKIDTLDAALIRNMKILLEANGDQLADYHALFVIGLYSDYPAERHACGELLPPVVDGFYSGLTGDLLFCDRLTQGLVKDATREQYLPYCLDRIARAKAIPVTHPRRRMYLDAFQTTSLTLLKSVSANLGGSQAERRSALQRHLSLLNRWFKQAKHDVYVSDAAGSDTEKLWKDVSELVGITWKALHAEAYQNYKTNGDLDAYRVSQLENDRVMLAALFSDFANPIEGKTSPPLTTAPALLFISDAFRGLSERLDSLAEYHDLACRFLSCDRKYDTNGDVVKNETLTEFLALYQLLGALANQSSGADSLRARLDAIDKRQSQSIFSTNWDLYRPLFRVIEGNQPSVIYSAVVDAYDKDGAAYDPDVMVFRTQADSPPPIVSFAALVRNGRERERRYLGTGLFLKDTAKSLQTGLLSSKISEIDRAVKDAIDHLDQAIIDFNNAKSTDIRTLCDEIEGRVEANDLLQRAKALFARSRELAMDDASLRISDSIDQARYADLNAEVETALKALMENGQPYVTASAKTQYTFKGDDGTFFASPGTHVDNIKWAAVTRLGTSGKVGTYEAGSIINSYSYGAYQPTCSLRALSGHYYGMPVEQNVSNGNTTVDLSSAETGTLGFRFEYSRGSFATKANTRSSTETTSTTLEACAGYSTPPTSPLSASLKACMSRTESESSSDAVGTGEESRATAAFATGLRLHNTPFPKYPAGALLVVLMKPGTTDMTVLGNVVDVQVVQMPQGSIVFARDADLYFVVNDVACTYASLKPATERTLTVEMWTVTPASSAMKSVVAGIKKVESYLRGRLEDPRHPGQFLPSKADSLIAQGKLSANDVTAVRNEAVRQFSTGSGYNLAELPAVVRGLFETWLDWQISHIDREAEHIAIAREMARIDQESSALASDLGSLDGKGRLANLLPRISLANLDFANSKLGVAKSKLVKLASDYLHPMMYLRYPEALSGLTEASKLLSIDWIGEKIGTTISTDNSSPLANKLYLALTEIRDHLDTAVLRSVSTASADIAEPYVAVRFPNPWNPYEALAGDPPVGRAVDEGRAAQVWRSILNSRGSFAQEPLRFEIRPSDLYDSGPGNGLLSCYATAPVVKSMAIYLVTSGTVGQLNSQAFFPVTRVGQFMSFPTQDGFELFRFDSEAWLTSNQTKPIFGKEVDWKSTFMAIPSGDLSVSVSGLSPFSKFTINPLGYYGDPFWDSITDSDPFGYAKNELNGNLLNPDRTSELIVIMQLEIRKSAKAVQVAGCQ